jgi:hypothetical protein
MSTVPLQYGTKMTKLSLMAYTVNIVKTSFHLTETELSHFLVGASVREDPISRCFHKRRFGNETRSKRS